MEELLDNLLFSATLPAVAFPPPGKPPTSAERIVHNGARRRLAERYGSDEYLALAERAHCRYLARKFPIFQIAAAGLLLFGAWLRPKSN
jgi:hypothetical protein